MLHRKGRGLLAGIASGSLVLALGGCLTSGKLLHRSVPTIVTYVAGEFLTDNDAVFDVFQDDFGTGANFDDRFVPGASRTEPSGAVNGTFNTGG
ncbi:MAG TPA: hypothetical protein VGM03_17925 [Phycisphaerae bacterium]